MRLPKQKSMRFTRLRLVNWRNFTSADVSFEASAFIVGPNASGKSNLLDALRFLGELARPGSGGLQASIAARGGFSAIRCLHARRNNNVELEVFIGTTEEPETWVYRLKLAFVNKEGHATVSEEVVTRSGQTIILRGRPVGGDAFEYAQTFLEQAGVNKDFRPLTEFLASCRYLHVVPQIVRDRTRARLQGEDPFGGDLLRRMKEMPKKTRLPRLTRIGEALRSAVPQFSGIDLTDDMDGVPHLWASFDHWRATASRQSETAFSDGTLRLIGLLWSIAEKGGPLLLEEPELSLNDAVIGQVSKMVRRMQRLSGRQVIMTTHSATLLDDAAVGLREIHLISVGRDGSVVQTLADNPAVVAQVDGGMTTSEAVFPLLRPSGIDALGLLDIAR